jgi:mannose-1-phosphate guanylyltransferase
MAETLVALVLAGGTGTRLYPASRSDRPKQFLNLLGDADAAADAPGESGGDAGVDDADADDADADDAGADDVGVEGDDDDATTDRSLLARTVARAGFADEVVVVTRPEFEAGVRERVPEATVLVEPEGKDTGPALTYATHRIDEAVDDPVVLALPSDHHVGAGFERVVRRGLRVAGETDRLVAFGVEPTRPDPGYGYIEPGTDCGDFRDLVRFHEKPDRETATRYLEEGYLWNAGIFAWTPAAFLDAARDSPLGPLVDALDRGDPAAGFAAVEPVSVDHAVMERAEGAAVVPADVTWDDLGSWDALERLLAADDAGNVATGDLLTVDAADNVVATDDKHVSLVGVEGLAVVAFDDRVLVVPKEDAQRVREVVAALRERGAF